MTKRCSGAQCPGVARPGRIFVALVTYRRPHLAIQAMADMAEQSRQPDVKILVDNGSDPTLRQLATEQGYQYIDTGGNVGPAGGIAAAMEYVLNEGTDEDLLLLLDDNDPPLWPDLVERLVAFATASVQADPSTAAVGVRGARYNPRTGTYSRLRDEELSGRVPVDVIHGGWFPLYRVSAIRTSGVFDRRLWFGFEEGEFGLRLRRSGYSLYADGDRWLEARTIQGELNRSPQQARTPPSTPPWRRYYSVRNAVVLAHRYGRPWTPWVVAAGGALRGTLGIARGRHPWPAIALPIRGALDGLLGRLGRRVDPPRPTTATASRPHLATEATVSIVVPVYRTERFLPRCVQSLLTQTHPELEIVLVDDGSPDDAPALCDALAAADIRVQVIHQANSGLSNARNAGTASTSCEWILFLDSDDWLHPQAIERLLTVARATMADIVVGGFRRIAADNDQDPALEEPLTTPPLLTGHDAVAALMGTDHTLLTIACGKLIRRSIALAFPFPPGRLHEDEFTTYKMLDAAERVAILREPLYAYRQHSASISGSGFNLKGAQDTVDAYRDRVVYLEERRMDDLLPKAHAQLFRKQLALLRGLPEGATRDSQQVLDELRRTARALRRNGPGGLFGLFARLTARHPRVMIPAYAAYNRVVNSRRRAKSTERVGGTRR